MAAWRSWNAHPVAAEHGAVEKVEERGTRHPGFLREGDDLAQGLHDEPQVQVAAQFDETRLLLVAGIDNCLADRLEVRPDQVIGLPGPDVTRTAPPSATTCGLPL